MPAALTRRDLLLSLAATVAAPARAQAPTGSIRCLVEVLFFRQPGPAPPAMRAGPLPQVTTIPGRVELLPESDWQLGAAEAALGRNGEYRPLAHALWAAVVPPNGRTTARLEDELPTGVPLAGALAVQRSQYLYLAVDVDFTSPEGPVYPMRERRRVKFAETQYFDHPAFGLIARVTATRGIAATD